MCCYTQAVIGRPGATLVCSVPNDPEVRQVWVEFVRRDCSCDWTPAKRGWIRSLHFGPDCYGTGNHRYLLEFGIALPKKRHLEPEAVPTLYAASAQHRDANPASESTRKRLCFQQTIELHRYVTIFCECLSPRVTA
ncbi:hypothetical protein HPB51_009461 [Rhipicephalus microplus]|uniref:THAP-type domain-containing protein n=1 Tax=Rhipicephalus microplus TaxID=6941 RepID=A0A9J6DU94_RHIMP|nr:hypothetical protein HPB51_009461 [Rhipicephalus microplus]